jgi:hypothetical protein
MEIGALAAFLAPLLPALLQGTQQLVEEAVTGLGHKAWECATHLWQRLSPRFKDKPAAQEAAEDAAARPDDARAQGAFELQLEKVLGADPDLAHEIELLWAKAQREGIVAAVGERSVAVRGDVSGSTIVTGDHNAIRE